MKKLLFSILALLAFVPFVGVKAQSLLTSLEVEGIGELSLLQQYNKLPIL